MFGKKCALGVLAIFASLYMVGCGGSAAPISVALTPGASTVDPADTTTITAVVTNDQGAKGVSWTISGTGGALSGQTTTSATFTASPAAAAAQSATITATSIANAAQTATVTITVPAKLSVTNSAPNALNGAVGLAYSVQIPASGGIPPYKNFAVAPGSLPLPACLTLNTSTGVITFTSTAVEAACAAGSPYAPAFTFQDSGTPTPQTGTTPDYDIVIAAAAPITFSPSLLAAAVGTAYVGGAPAVGGMGALTYAVASGALPTDLSLNTATGAITGTPKAADVGTATFTISASDAFGDTVSSGTLHITVTGPTITFPSTLVGATVGTAYNASAAATGALGTSTYSIASGGLPSSPSGGLVLNTSTGAITGTPHAADVGTATFQVKVVDAYGDTATSGNLSITVTGPTITFPSTLAGATVGTAYNASAAATGALGASTYSIASGSLPASGNLVFDTSTGGITGTPHAADVGTATFKVKVVDAYGDTATSGNLSIDITAPRRLGNRALNVLVNMRFGTRYTGSVAGATPGGVAPLTYSITAGSLPTGLQFNTGTGVITGTTTVAGTFNFTVRVSDNYGDTPATKSYTLTVQPAAASKLAISPATTTPAAGTAFNVTVTEEDQYGNTFSSANNVKLTGSGPATFTALNQSLASGITTFSVTLTAAGSWTLTAADN